MKNYLYPAVVYPDRENRAFTITIPDLNIVTEGETIEKAYLAIKEYVKNFLKVAIALNCVISEPSSFVKLYKQNKGADVLILLIDVDLDEAD